MPNPTQSLVSNSSTEPSVYSFYEKVTGTWTYVVVSPDESKETAIIDSVLDFDPASGAVTTGSADVVLEFVKKEGLKVSYILETHAHADHLTASRYLAHSIQAIRQSRPLIGIGSRILQVQKTFGPKYKLENLTEKEWKGMFDLLWKDDEIFKLSNLNVKAVHLPGHTPDSMGYVIGNKVFTGDSIFLPDVGSARADFPNGSAHALYKSMNTLLALDPNTTLYVGHDYPPSTRVATACSTVEEQKVSNKHVKSGTTEEEFVKFRQERDDQLAVPRLLHYSLQVNIRGGRLPEKDADGKRRFVLPLEVKGGDDWA